MKEITTTITCVVELTETFAVNDDLFLEIQTIMNEGKWNTDTKVMSGLYTHLEIHALERDMEYYYVCDDQEDTLQINEISFNE